MDSVYCPYCDHKNEELDDCNEQETLYEIECEGCKKIFGYTFTYNKYFTEVELPCANGEDHNWEKINGIPKELFENKYRCSYCDKEKEIK